jgi:NAD(P)-dependent dehydrogenase (short-subunit alcohol dehydrogenase family)
MTTGKGIDIFSLHDKTALVTGAGGHLGLAMSEALAEAGANLLVHSRSKRRAEQTARRLWDAGHKAEPAVFDVTDEAAIGRFFSESLQDKPLHIVINNAYEGSAGDSMHATQEDFLQSYDVGLVAAHRILSAAKSSLLRAKEDSGDSSVINVSSMYGLVSPDQRIYETPESANPPFYGAVKAALVQWTRYVACELGPSGIRVNAISPGPFPSADVQRENSAFVNRLADKLPLGRIGLPNELKGATLFLASSASSYVTGANIVIDGGWTCW